MNWRRIRAMVMQEWFITRHSLEVVSDLFIITTISLLVFGFFARFAELSGSQLAADYVLAGFVLWEIFHVAQYTVSVTSMWNIWSRNLLNIFITPLSVAEYIAAQMLSGLIKTGLVFLLTAGIANWAFGFNIFRVPPLTLAFGALILLISAWALGIAILGVIFGYGTRYQAVTWSLIYVFQPLTAAFFPLAILPGWLHPISWLLPPTYVFEVARQTLTGQLPRYDLLFIAFCLSLVYLAGGVAAFVALFRHSRATGEFTKLE